MNKYYEMMEWVKFFYVFEILKLLRLLIKNDE